MAKYYAIALSAYVLTALAQVLMKAGAVRWKGGNVLSLYLNPWTGIAYSLFFAVTFLTTYAFKYIPIKSAVFLLPTTLVTVILLSRWVFKEKITSATLAGFLLVLIGVLIYNL